jgi:hypothetical protein
VNIAEGDKVVYISGKMAGRPVGEVLDERLQTRVLCRKWGLRFIDPADGEGLEKLERNAIISFYYTEEQMAAFVAKDEADVLRSQFLLVLTGDTPSDGTWWEMSLAKQFNIPIIMVAPKRAHGMMGFSNFKVTQIFETIEAAVVYISEHYSGVQLPRQMEVV